MTPGHLHRTLHRRQSDDLFSVIGVLLGTWFIFKLVDSPSFQALIYLFKLRNSWIGPLLSIFTCSANLIIRLKYNPGS